MSGRTGKLTREAMLARGPRMVLAYAGNGLVIWREGKSCFAGHPSGSIVAKSYTLRYLLKVGVGQRIPA